VAGFYPDVPGFRFEYDRDGSIAASDAGTFTVGTTQSLNDESGGGPYTSSELGSNWFGVAFPEHRDLTGIFIIHDVPSYSGSPYINHDVWTSADTTNVADGVWIYRGTIPANAGTGGITGQVCRTDIEPLVVPGIRGVRVGVMAINNMLHAFHLYGSISAGENPDRLILCDGTGAAVTDGAYFDFGDSPRATIATKPFRIKNNSALLTAHSVTVSFEALSPGSPTNLGQFDFSTDGGTTWMTSQNIGSLGPGATTSAYQLRRNTLITSATGPWQLRLLAVPASMT
jgi:hypothetical protein